MAAKRFAQICKRWWRTRAEKARAPREAPRSSSGVQEQMSRVAATQPPALRSRIAAQTAL